MLSARGKRKSCTSYQLPPLHIATLHIDQGTHTHTPHFFLFAQILTQRSAALLGIYLTHIYTLFKLTHTLAACDWATVRMMKIKWTILCLSSSDLHSNSILPSLSPTVTLHNTQIFPECLCSTCIEVGWGGRGAQRSLGSAPQQEGLLTSLNCLYAHGSLQSADIGIFGFVNVCIHFILGNVLFCFVAVAFLTFVAVTLLYHCCSCV